MNLIGKKSKHFLAPIFYLTFLTYFVGTLFTPIVWSLFTTEKVEANEYALFTWIVIFTFAPLWGVALNGFLFACFLLLTRKFHGVRSKFVLWIFIGSAALGSISLVLMVPFARKIALTLSCGILLSFPIFAILTIVITRAISRTIGMVAESKI